MKIEFFKLSRSIIVWLWLFAVVAIILGTAFYYNAHLVKYPASMSEVPRYSSQEDLAKVIKELKESREEAKNNGDDDFAASYERQIRACECVYEHYVPYEKITDLSDFGNTRNMPAHFVALINSTTYPLFICAILLPVLVFCANFTNGTYKNEFVGNPKRWKIVLNKYAVCMISTVIAAASVGLLSFLMSLSYFEADTYVLQNSAREFFVMPSVVMCLLLALSMVLMMCVVETVLFSLALLIKNQWWSIAAEIAFVALMLVIIQGTIPELNKIAPLFEGFFAIGDEVSFGGYALFSAVKLILACGLFFAGLTVFEKRDI